MNSFLGQRRVILACLLALGVDATAPSVSLAAARPDPTVKKTGFRLFARAGGSLRVNQVQCGIISDGQICVDSTGSSTIPGSVWPKGTNNQYTFNSGISIAGVIGPEVAAWAGDTTGAFFFDGGGKQNGEQVEPIYNASDPADFNAWPAFARVPDGSDPGADIYDPLLQGTVSASQGDVYFLTWDGNPTALTGRPHPMGVLVETRGLAWNFPTGNQDIIYFVYTLYNITSINDVDYGDVRPGLKAVLLAKAQEFQTKNEAAFGIDIPAGGYALQDVFMAFAADQDVTAAAGANYSTFNIPFATAVTYHERFEPAPGNTFDPGIHAPPFLPGPGFVGTKYLRSPIIEGSSPPQEVGLALATLTTLRGAFPDPNNTSQLYRYMSATINPGAGDPQCNTGDPTVTKICFINNNPSDTRTFQSSGPLQLAPGGQATIVVGYIFAAPLATGKCPTIPCPVTMRPAPLTILNATPGNAGVDAIDSAMGYRGLSPTAGSPLTQQDFLVEPNSLLAKALVAQTVFDNKFLLPFAPTAPEFFVVPGNAQVSILWRPSSSEASGDAFFTIASNPTTLDAQNNPIPNPLYDPNYRSDDVEGYRIYRGRTDTPNQLELLAQFDYGETFISDHRGIVYAAENPTCAPELSVTAGCTAPFDNPAPGAPFVQHVDVLLVGDVIQTKPGDRVELANGEILVTSADTALIGGGSGLPPLADTGIPFAFTDDGSGLLSAPRNNVRYFYSVTAFDVNSFFSGPSSLESQRVTKPVTPTRPASNVEAASLSSGIFGDDGTELNPEPATPFLIDAQTGRFSGPPPATGVASLQGVFAPLVPVLLPSLNLTGKLDSVLPRSGATCAGVANFQGLCYEFFVTFTRDATSLSSSSLAQWPIWTGFSEPSSVQNQLGAFAVEPDAGTAARFGIPQGAASFNAAIGATMAQNIRFSAHEGQLGRRVGGSSTTPPSTATLFVSPGGSRWFEGANESVNDPTYSIRVGHLTGVDTIFAPTSHIDQDPTTTGIQPTPTGPLTSTCLQVLPYVVAPLSRQADIELTWGAGGQVASVRDITNHIDVPFKRAPQASYGFIPDRNGNGAIDWTDIYGVEGIAPAVSSLAVTAAFCTVNHDPGVAARPPLTAQPTIGPVSTVVSTEAPGGLTSTGTGFGLYINGQQFLFQLTGGQPPAAGTKWTLRSYSGTVLASAATAATTDPSGYTFAPVAGSPSIPGLEIRFTVDQATQVNAPAPGNLDAVHTVPDPYYVTSAFETTTENKVIKFVNLPNQAIIRIYSSSGVLVSVLEHNSVTLGGDETWNVRNRNNQIVASGVYFYHIEAANQRKVGRFTVVNFAQ